MTSDASQSYTSRRADALACARKLDGRGALLAHGRALSFLGAVVLGGLTVFDRLPGWGWAAAGASLLIYIVLAHVHGRVITAEERARVRAALNDRGLSRLDGKWHDFPEKGERFLVPEHPYATDLDVFGQGSLFQLLDESATRAGEAKLASWLSAASPPDVVRARQEAVKELAPRVDFRQALLVESRMVARQKVDPGKFVEWAEGGPYLREVRWARPLGFVLPPLTLALFVLGRYEVVERWYWWGGLFALGAIVAVTRKPLNAFYERVVLGENGFVRFGETFGTVEGQVFSSPLLAERVGRLSPKDGKGASDRLSRFSRLFSFAEARQSSQLHAALNVLTLWDLHWLLALERWREENGARVRGWFEALAELEALCSLATYSYERPDLAWPELLDDGPAHFEAEELWHPLLKNAVSNDVRLCGPRAALMVTGSNMSGKTTLLRAMGANAVLAQAGAPVSARRLAMSPLQLFTSMRVKDSLERGVSYFYAEVQRIRSVLEGAGAAGGKAMFLLDEILLGTNTRERQIASREILRLLLETGAIGAVTTHDLSLTELGGVNWATVRNVHFRDVLDQGRMTFDYRMRDGVVETTNALRVLRDAGVPVPPEAHD
jgi:hypothetical protein